MARLDISKFAGTAMGALSVASPGAWTDVAIDGWNSITADAIPAGASMVALAIRETAGNPAYLLLRENDSEATSVAAQIPASGAQIFETHLSTPVSTISVYGDVHLQSYWV